MNEIVDIWGRVLAEIPLLSRLICRSFCRSLRIDFISHRDFIEMKLSLSRLILLIVSWSLNIVFLDRDRLVCIAKI